MSCTIVLVGTLRKSLGSNAENWGLLGFLLPSWITLPLILGHFHVGSYRYRSLIEGLYTL